MKAVKVDGAGRTDGYYKIVDHQGESAGMVRQEDGVWYASADHQDFELPVRSIGDGVTFIEHERQELLAANHLPKVDPAYNLDFARRIKSRMDKRYKNADAQKVLWACLLFAGGTTGAESVRALQEFLAAVADGWNKLDEAKQEKPRLERITYADLVCRSDTPEVPLMYCPQCSKLTGITPSNQCEHCDQPLFELVG
jgi:hypothetical protein